MALVLEPAFNQLLFLLNRDKLALNNPSLLFSQTDQRLSVHQLLIAWLDAPPSLFVNTTSQRQKPISDEHKGSKKTQTPHLLKSTARKRILKNFDKTLGPSGNFSHFATVSGRLFTSTEAASWKLSLRASGDRLQQRFINITIHLGLPSCS